ncbi:MAG: helix-turn-helix transcriptional regulator [Eubacteriales bacterium]|nr:helix-turn-helix transcriptional regulator [Eubacteriales bacterium]
MGLLQDWYVHETINNEEERTHRPQNEEIAFYQAVSSGDIDAVRHNCEQNRFTESEGVGILSRNPVTNLKYHFVITTALITRLCVEAGMEMEQAFRLSDFYILKLDPLHSIQEVARLHDRMVLDFTGKMRLLKKNAGTSKPVTACIDYIYAHIKERITIEDLAAHTGLCTSYLSRLFKEEVGISVSDYIREKKIEKAQNLLKFCDYSLIEIANYLSFSSQSHFIQIFKKLVGMTPKKYRDLYYCTGWTVTIPDKPGTTEA